MGDINHDGISEIAVGSPYWGPYYTGAAFLFTSPYADLTYAADGATATIAGSWGSYDKVCDPRFPVVSCVYYPTGSLTGWDLVRLGDLTGDGVPDFGVGSEWEVQVITDGTVSGEVVVTESGVNVDSDLEVLTGAADLDGDGAGDAYAEDAFYQVNYCRMKTGETGERRLSCTPVLRPLAGADGGPAPVGDVQSADLTGDGVEDLVVGWPRMVWQGQQVGGILVISGVDIIDYVRRVEGERAGAPGE